MTFMPDQQIHEKPGCHNCGNPSIGMIHFFPYCGQCIIKWDNKQKTKILQSMSEDFK